jgi:adenylate kinase family enzyme
LLGPDDPLPAAPERILVAGTSGAGKTTLAVALSRAIGLPHTEIDALFHGPGWMPRESFVEDAYALAEQRRWVTEWQYSAVRPRFLERCDVLVWLDLPIPLVMWQVVARTVRRRWGREELWNGNREAPLRTVLTDRDHIVRWAWQTRHHTARRVEQALVSRPDLCVVRLRRRDELRRWLKRIEAGSIGCGFA